MDYWNATASSTSTGEPIDAIISPLAPFAAARPETYRYYAYSVWGNLLDYTSVVIPVTTASRKIDPRNEDYKPLNEDDEYVQGLCMSFHLCFEPTNENR